ncbi:MAG: MATE family efflux transporter, partial [Pseudobutyrivibrio sp.]|nr:MATE family efflux transporter [Pseudobutyrivibrio sp.]
MEVLMNNPMKEAPVNKLMLKMGTPIILSMMMQALYNIVDSAFVSNMGANGEMALNALTLAFPVQVLLIALGIGTGVGMNVVVARSLGQQDYEKASRAAGTTKVLAFIIFAAFFLFGAFGVKLYIGTQTTNATISDMAVVYLRICCMLSLGNVYFTVYEKLLQAHGRSKYSTIAQIAGALTNIILDPILIYGLLGLPRMEVVGAALATVIGQFVSMGLGWYFHRKYDNEVSNDRKYLKLNGVMVKEIYSIGFPAIIAQALMSIMTYLLNIIFVRIGENVVTAYGLYYKIQQFILFAAFGMRDTITPIISFAHGMKDEKRIKDGMKWGILYTSAIMLLGTVLLEIFASPFANMFGLAGETEDICIAAMRIVSISFLFAGFNISFQGIYQALNAGPQSLVISVLRQFVLVIPVAFVFSNLVIAGTTFKSIIWFT